MSIEAERVGCCPACGSASSSPFFQDLQDRLFGAPGSWTLLRCQGCGAAYLDPRPTATSIGNAYRNYYTHSFDASEAPPLPPARRFERLKASLRNGYLASRYGVATGSGLALSRWIVPLFFPRHRIAFDTSVRHLALPFPGARLLDVGCGSGSFLNLARSAGWEVTGLEIDAQAAIAARRTGAPVVELPLQQAGFPTDFFDAVTLSHVIEHLHDPVSTLAEARRILKPGGVLWVCTPNLDSPLRRRLGPAWRGLEPPRHLVLFNRRSLQRMAVRAGFGAMRWPAAYPVTRWIHEASMQSAAAPDATRGCTRLELNLLVAAAFLLRSASEEIVLLAKKPAR